MATVTKPLALNESLNSTENTPRNIADVLADELDGIKQAINNQSGSGNGHIIQNSSGANMPSENTMQFVDAHLSDDSVGGKTVVETFKAVTEAEYSSETEDGAYIITDGDGAVIEPASEDYVEVEADGNKTRAQLLNELFALVDMSKVKKDVTYLTLETNYIYRLSRITSNDLIFFASFGVANQVITESILVGANSTVTNTRTQSNNSVAYADGSSVKPSNHAIYRLYYGQKKAVVDLQTTANRCWYDANTNVKQKIDSKANLCTSFLTETSFALNSASQDYTVLHDGLYCLTMMSGSNTAHDVSIFCGSTAISGDYLSYQYQKLNSQVPLKKGTTITFYGASGDGVVINYGQ